uniref:NADH-ubiquinone oxidoreductase chain 1 n=1 Tax=Oncicola luehei TaxID=1100885 RepID=H2E2E2_9BILA|nr:NADH dehydrogenase subunit 1 [Oncicola luehei]AER42901.1 NADH dehydrogenase subunit 1 [Oncicola luehei]
MCLVFNSMRLLVVAAMVLVLVLLLVAYFTMLERKVLGYGQLRKGPNKVVFLGLGQPLLDGVKLMMKSFHPLMGGVGWAYLGLPMLVFVVMMSVWSVSLSIFGMFGVLYYMLVFMVLVGLMVLSVFVLSVYSGSKYGAIGAMRGLAQMVSYEILMGLILLIVVMVGFSFEFTSSGLLIYFLPLMLVWWVVCVVETNRAPVDFVEGESELVSGFNVEFGSVLFAMLFLGEYGMMAVYSVVSVYMFCSVGSLSASSVLSLGLMVMFLWWRLTFPRYRYDLLMDLSWSVFLPVVLVFFLSSFVLISL